MPALLILSLWADIGYNIILFISGLQSIPLDYLDAAQIDGAGQSGAFQYHIPAAWQNVQLCDCHDSNLAVSSFRAICNVAPNGGIGRRGYVQYIYLRYGFPQQRYGVCIDCILGAVLYHTYCNIMQQRLNRVDWGY